MIAVVLPKTAVISTGAVCGESLPSEICRERNCFAGIGSRKINAAHWGRIGTYSHWAHHGAFPALFYRLSQIYVSLLCSRSRAAAARELSAYFQELKSLDVQNDRKEIPRQRLPLF